MKSFDQWVRDLATGEGDSQKKGYALVVEKRQEEESFNFRKVYEEWWFSDEGVYPQYLKAINEVYKKTWGRLEE